MDFSSSNPDNFGIAGSTAGTGTPGGQTGWLLLVTYP